MEHIVQFAISMDDEAIKQRVAANAEKAIIKDLKDGVEEVIFKLERGWNGDRKKIGISRWAEAHFEEFLEENKEAIVQRAAVMLADRMARTKVVREAAVAVVQKEA